MKCVELTSRPVHINASFQSIQNLKKKHRRSFQPSWFKLFPSWLEYSPSADAVYCLPCFLFHTEHGPPGSNAFTIVGFRSWKKVRDGINCSLLAHSGKDLTSPHRNAEKSCAALMNQESHIAQSIAKFTSQEVAENRLRLKTSIEAIRWLAFQGCSLRGHDESTTSSNRGNSKTSNRVTTTFHNNRPTPYYNQLFGFFYFFSQEALLKYTEYVICLEISCYTKSPAWTTSSTRNHQLIPFSELVFGLQR
ncbi:unnamed protein product [Cuscuta epithymum]|uniref:TTF-type domain-containing protein n=1 Tax=Cuscuta epithymum TaxID=186058 RepID=A0AAV0GB39_9ASTE|nr:unnamed protein product [Cuscuta epithymum]